MISEKKQNIWHNMYTLDIPGLVDQDHNQDGLQLLQLWVYFHVIVCYAVFLYIFIYIVLVFFINNRIILTQLKTFRACSRPWGKNMIFENMSWKLFRLMSFLSNHLRATSWSFLWSRTTFWYFYGAVMETKWIRHCLLNIHFAFCLLLRV